ncbi:hypothetical protein PFMG_00005 [Plasmodium falciparum IGH-CR14]|uniref:Uncharacterized protein n=1 Tax=Plasmodium falciparum IGH-CR14 TaxID=580059 RepID=A0A0L1I3S2_PLAFA|nr:hypothetical protein PFMG_00005 [Plasmodium falciparum IGH-CR14]
MKNNIKNLKKRAIYVGNIRFKMLSLYKRIHTLSIILKNICKSENHLLHSSYMTINRIEKRAYTNNVKRRTDDYILNILENNGVVLNKIGNFIVVKEDMNLLYERIIFNPVNYERVIEFIQMLDKNNLRQDFDIYYYEDSLRNIKLNRDQNKKEIFINIKEILEKGKKIKNDEKKNYLEKQNIQSLYYYNIQRYQHNKDPSSFLIDRRRLTKEEYIYQFISSILPYICFSFMLFFPHILICLYIPYIKKKNEKQKELCKILQLKQNIHSFKDIKPENILQIIDNNVKTVVFFYNHNIFLNMYIKSLMIDLSKIFKYNSIPDLNTIRRKLKKCIFEHDIMNKNKGDILYDYGCEVAHLSCLKNNNKLSFY